MLTTPKLVTMGTGASLSATDIPESVDADHAERLVGNVIWSANGKSYFEKHCNGDGFLSREQFIEFVNLEQAKAAEIALNSQDPDKDYVPILKESGRQRRKGKLSESELAKKLERKRRREIMRLQKARAAQELCMEQDSETAARLRAEYEANLAELDRRLAADKQRMKAKLQSRRKKSKLKRMQKAKSKQKAMLKELDTNAADDLAARLAEIQEQYAAEKAAADENQVNLMTVQEKYKANVHAARLEAMRQKQAKVGAEV